MTDALFAGLDFGDDQALAGFRLSRLEILNWGTFDRATYVVDLAGQNGLLTGDIGSGKSTVVDAITTLLVPPARISYNKAAGAETKERSLATYVLGHYKTEKSDSGSATKAVSLRTHKTVSVLLSEFRNDGYDQTLTLAQVFYFKKTDGQPERFYVLSSEPLTIDGDFLPGQSSITDMRKHLRTKGCSVEDSFEKYRAEFSRIMGIRNPQALDLFHQTVSMKQVGNLTTFVRSHMLEPFNVADRRTRLLDHFEDLQRAHDSIQKAKRQIELLAPLCTRLEQFRTTQEQLASERDARDGLVGYFAKVKCDLLEKRLVKLQADLERVGKKIESLDGALEGLRTREADLALDIAGRGGDRLQQLQAEQDRLSKLVDKRRQSLEKFTVHAEAAGLDLPTSAEELAATQQAAHALLATLMERSDRLEGETSELHYQLRTQETETKELIDEINSLLKRENNLPAATIELRRRICDGVGLTAPDLPYVGEVLAVDEHYLDWEGAAERVLRPFSLSLLVPDEHYRRVANWVNQNSLRGRLVYYRVSDVASSHLKEPSEDSLVDALKVKPDFIHAEWLYSELVRRFDYVRCTSMENFARHTKAITQSGHIKASRSKHEKDDRSDVTNRSRYTLGWSNKDKIALLTKSRDESLMRIHETKKQLSSLAHERAQLRKAADGCNGVRNFTDFQDLNWQEAAQERQRIVETIKEIEASSDVLASLREQLADTKEQIKTAEERKSAAAQERGGLCSKIEIAQANVKDLHTSLAEHTVAEHTSTRIDEWVQRVLDEPKFTVENCDTNAQRVRKAIQEKIDSLNKQSENHRTRIVARMQEFRGEYPLESREFDADLDAGPEYESLLAKLEQDDLPRFAAAFKEMLNKNALHEIASFHAALDNEALEITGRIQQINEALSKIDYNPGRHIVLERHAGRDREVEEFKADLKACLADSVGPDSDETYSETRFEQVKKILDRFAKREGMAEVDKRWTEKVTDVRNWFSFSASERWKEDGTEHEHYTDSGGKSGGQKEKLAYTILAASLAYKFGLDWGEVRSRSMRFVVIDEAFGRGSDESAEYGLKLFAALNLQLMIVTPLQKINVIEPHVRSVTYVSNSGGKSSHLRTLSMQEYREGKAQSEAGQQLGGNVEPTEQLQQQRPSNPAQVDDSAEASGLTDSNPARPAPSTRHDRDNHEDGIPAALGHPANKTAAHPVPEVSDAVESPRSADLADPPSDPLDIPGLE